MSFYQKLENLLISLDKFQDHEGKLIKNLVVDSAYKIDPELIELLIKDGEAKAKFFVEIADCLVFNINSFVLYIQDKNFLDDSYTRFKNKIGLTINDKFLNQKKEVSLVWAYKDCVLEGGQDKEDQKRKEIFFNEVLAEDEIDRLLDPKVLVNWTRHTVNGPERVADLKRDEDGILKENLLIKGNNLLVLHSLKKQFRGKVKLIYIDPPYNTGNDGFQYNDNFNHSTWLTFMKNRLEIAKELLREDGVIFVQCDDNEQAYLKVLMDEVFGKDFFVSNSIVVINRGGRDYGGVAKTHEYILIYSRTQGQELNFIESPDKVFSYKDEISGFNLMELRNRNVLFNKENRPNLCYPFFVNPNNEDSNGLLELSLTEKEGFIEVMPLKSQGIQTVWRWGKEKALENLNSEIKGKSKLDGGFMIVQKYRKTSSRQRSVWDDKLFVNERGSEHMKEMFSKKVFAYPKSEHLISRVVELGSEIGDIVLDFHAGTGTSGAVAHKMNRQWILVEQMNYIKDLPEARLVKVLEGEQGGISKTVNWHGGGDFIYLELAKFNESYVESIQEDKNSKELWALWLEMKEKAFLNYRVETVNFTNEDFLTLTLEEQKNLLASVLDKNQLYINYTEIDDEDYKISQEDKDLNKQFYQK